VNADQMAVACAAAFGARQLIFLTDVEGVLDGAGCVRPVLTVAESRRLIADGVATGGMQAKLNAALAALAAASSRCGSPRARPKACLIGFWRATASARAMAPDEVPTT